MILLNLHRIMLRKGITKTYTYLRQLGFTHFIATNYRLGNSKSIKYAHIQKLCMALHCTPNDIFEWKNTDKDIDLPEGHPLQAIHHQGTVININSLLINSNPETLVEVEKFLVDKFTKK